MCTEDLEELLNDCILTSEVDTGRLNIDLIIKYIKDEEASL